MSLFSLDHDFYVTTIILVSSDFTFDLSMKRFSEEITMLKHILINFIARNFIFAIEILRNRYIFINAIVSVVNRVYI